MTRELNMYPSMEKSAFYEFRTILRVCVDVIKVEWFLLWIPSIATGFIYLQLITFTIINIINTMTHTQNTIRKAFVLKPQNYFTVKN